MFGFGWLNKLILFRFGWLHNLFPLAQKKEEMIAW
jgi:hypothetical protein